MQEDTFAEATFSNLLEMYRAHRKRILPGLPSTVRPLANTYYHDCVVQSISFLRINRIDLVLNGFKHFFKSDRAVDGTHHLTFTGVKASNISINSLGDYWSYEEVDVFEGAPEFRVLLADSEFYIRFSGFRTRTEHPTNRESQ